MNTKRMIVNMARICVMIAILTSLSSMKASAAVVPANDNFANATLISGTPYSDMVDTIYATVEPGEPTACSSNFQKTIWYAFTPTSSGEYTAETTGGYPPVLAIYTGSDLSSLLMIDCRADWNASRISLLLEAGTTYYFQAFDTYDACCFEIGFNLYPTPPPEATFSYYPPTPGINQNVEFDNTSFDPAGVGFQTLAWDFGDGATSEEWSPWHYYSSAGDYTVQLSVTTYDGRTASTSQIVPVRDLTPGNDNFANAKVIPSIPYTDSVNIWYATTEPGEPAACGWYTSGTIWYAFTPPSTGSYTAENTAYATPAMGIYTGSNINDLQSIACMSGWDVARTTLQLEGGTTYYFQIFMTYTMWGSGINFSLYPAPPTVANFSYWPGDANIYESIQFSNDSVDPGGNAIQTCAWDFGDGNTSAECYPLHLYNADGDYTVQLTITTTDGRSASTSQTLPVRTHDVGITRFAVPSSARVGQTRPVNVYIKNLYNPETVQVDLYKSGANGYEWVGSLTQYVPIRPANRAQLFSFNYTFSSLDAEQGKVIFKAVATVTTSRDAYPADNEMLSLSTRVTR